MHMLSIGMNSCMMTVVYPSTLQHKPFFLLPRITCTDSFSVGVVTRDKVKWLLGNLTPFSVSQPILLYQLR